MLDGLFLHLGAGTDGERSFILYSEDPRYELLPTKTGVRRWQLVADSGLIIPSGERAPTAMAMGVAPNARLEDIERLSLLDDESERGHSPMFLAKMKNGSQYIVKMSTTSSFIDPLRENYGVDDPDGLVGRYDLALNILKSPHMPHGIIGSVKDLRDINPKFGQMFEDELREAYGPDKKHGSFVPYEFDDETSLVDFLEVNGFTGSIIASPYAPPDKTYVDWRYFGEDVFEATHNLQFLADKEGLIIRALLQLPDRNPGNILMYSISDDENWGTNFSVKTPTGWPDGALTSFPIEIDYAWYPPLMSGGGIFNRRGLQEPKQVARQTVASMALKAGGHFDAGRWFAKVVEGARQLEAEGYADPACEALADTWSRLDDLADVDLGPGPNQVVNELVNGDFPELHELARVWKGIREDRLRSGPRQSRKSSFIFYSKDPHYRLLPAKGGKKRWQLVDVIGQSPESGKRADEMFPQAIDMVAWRPLDTSGKGHVPIYVGTMDDGSEWVFKWHDGPAPSEGLKYLSKYIGDFLALKSPVIPQVIFGTVDDIALKHPDWYEDFEDRLRRDKTRWVRRRGMLPNEGFWEYANNLGLENMLIASPYLPPEKTPVNWKQFGTNPKEAAANLDFLQWKHLLTEAVTGAPDRHSQNYLKFPIRFPRSFGGRHRKTLRLGIDYDWNPQLLYGLRFDPDVSGGVEEAAIESLIAGLFNRKYGNYWDAERNSTLLTELDSLAERAVRKIEKGKRANPKMEALADVWTRLPELSETNYADDPKTGKTISVFYDVLASRPALGDLFEAWIQSRGRLTGKSG